MNKSISIDEFDCLVDVFNSNFNACKKALFFESNFQDKKLRSISNDIAIMHNDICNKIIAILEDCYNE